MLRSTFQLRADAERIWYAGVAAVAPERLIRGHVRVDRHTLQLGNEILDLRAIGRIAIVGAGKAAGAMAVAIEEAFGPQLLAEKNVTGWVNVPADCIVATRYVTLHAARPAGVNEPRLEGVEGTRQILELVGSLESNDLCVCVISGGGSALLPAPVPGISLNDKIRLTRSLSAAGANIEQLNMVRRELSLVKGGGLARACNAGRLISLIISDVLGDPLDLIASGPTVPHNSTAADALAVLRDLQLIDEPMLAPVAQYLQTGGRESFATGKYSLSSKPLVAKDTRPRLLGPQVSNVIIGNNATAVDAAGAEAERLGYSHAMISTTRSEGPAEDVGRHLAAMALRMRDEAGPDCLISGGEPTVALIEAPRRGKGGRNQQLALAALSALGKCKGIALLSGGTDGEDGPTDAAGAIATEDVARQARKRQLDPQDYLSRNDAYTYFKASDGLLITGPTHTNVCDLRVVLVDRSAET
jgi:glycerate 2-kinase